MAPEVSTMVKSAFICGVASALFLGLAYYMWRCYKTDVTKAALSDRLLALIVCDAYQMGPAAYARRVALIQQALSIGNLKAAEFALGALEDDLGQPRGGKP